MYNNVNLDHGKVIEKENNPRIRIKGRIKCSILVPFFSQIGGWILGPESIGLREQMYEKNNWDIVLWGEKIDHFIS